MTDYTWKQSIMSENPQNYSRRKIFGNYQEHLKKEPTKTYMNAKTKN